jgi:hypothetical protein
LDPLKDDWRSRQYLLRIDCCCSKREGVYVLPKEEFVFPKEENLERERTPFRILPNPLEGPLVMPWPPLATLFSRYLKKRTELQVWVHFAFNLSSEGQRIGVASIASHRVWSKGLDVDEVDKVLQRFVSLGFVLVKS